MAKSPKGIGGWLAVVLAVLALALVSAVIMTAQRISPILLGNASSGVYISLALLLPYVALLAYTIYLLIKKRKDAITMFISSAIIGGLFAIWFFIIGQAIYAPALFKLAWKLDAFIAASNIALSVAVAFYLLKSKRVKNTLTVK